MPCYDARNNESREVYIDNPKDKRRISELSDRNKALEAGLCAIITELEKAGIADRIITQASKGGLIDLVGFWGKHSKEDQTRLSLKLHEFSEHEQDILRRLLNDKTK